MDGVTMAGGVAVLLPPQTVGDGDIADWVLDGLDGLIITGGRDVDPAFYGQQRHPATDAADDTCHRDVFELAVVHEALRRGMPVLGICRGAQVLNVALGGTLHQHLPDVIGHARHQRGNAMFSTSAVRTVPGTRLAALIGESSDAQCYHHQAIDRLGEGLIVSARDSDGVIEAVEAPGDHFVLGVQWHPEQRLDDLHLFASLVEEATEYTSNRAIAHAVTTSLAAR